MAGEASSVRRVPCGGVGVARCGARGTASKGTIDWEIPPHSQGRFEGDPADYVFAEAITTDDVLIHVLLSVIAVDPE